MSKTGLANRDGRLLVPSELTGVEAANSTSTPYQGQGAGTVQMAIDRIRDVILEGNLSVGARLPAERELAKRFGVGRPALREAVRALSIMGVLETRRGSGNYVKSPFSVDTRGWPSRVMLNESNFPLLQLLEVRQMFEPKAASLAASRASTSELRRIESHLRAQESSPTSEILEREDLLFHQAIIDAAGNPVLQNLIRAMQPMLTMSRQLTACTTPDIPNIIRQHRTIFEAISLGQSELAEAAMARHLRTVGLDIISDAAR